MIKPNFNTKLIKTLVLILLLCVNTPLVFSAREYANKSVLSTGIWTKIKIEDTGIYKLTYNDLKNMGFNNPQNVQVFGYGGNIQNENFALDEYIDDLPQVAIWMSSPKENFGVNDYILFYGKGIIKWTFDKIKKEFIQTQNPYSDNAYYFLTESASNSKIVTNQSALPDNGGTTITSYQDYYLHEKELTNISQTGRYFYGEDFAKENSQTFNFTLTGIATASQNQALISYEFISLPKSAKGSLKVTVNQTNAKTQSIDIPSSSYAVASVVSNSYSQSLFVNNSINFEYTEGSANDINRHLNYFRINYTKKLEPYGAVTLFRSTETAMSGKLNFTIDKAPQNGLVFDVTDGKDMTLIQGQLNNDTYQFGATNTSIKEYALVDLDKEIPSPTFVANIENQNLHSLEAKDMIIIVQPSLKKYAEQLANIHFENSGLQSLIVHPEDIFNEFSSGVPDATAYRSFLKMLYDKANTNKKEAPKYLLLFGDGTYDNRLLDDKWKSVDTRAFLLTYQSENSISEVNSYVSDDYFGFLDDNEGYSLKDDKLDLGIGRLPVRTEMEAYNVVNKIARYLKNETPGLWQNNVVFLADDAIGSSSSNSASERVHMVDSDSFANFLNANYPDFRTTKLYMDSYKRVISINTTAKQPEGRKQLLNTINSGALILNYMGHGSQNDWTHEAILTGEDINNMRNEALPLWITATCDFSRFDNDATSAGELTVLNPYGGAIALFSTVRVVFASSNKLINASLFEYIFTEKNGRPLRLGDMMRYAKTKSSYSAMASDSNKLRFLLIGDPAVRLNYPSSQHSIQIESINNSAVSEPINISSLSEVIIKGKVIGQDGKIDSSFNGLLETSAFDNEQNLSTRGQISSKTTVPSEDVALKYVDYTNKIYSGKVKVDNGEFTISFIVPKDVSYSGNKGKMFFIAHDITNNKEAKGSYSNYKISSSSNTVEAETTPPSIETIYINNATFVSGQIIQDQSTLHAQISDNTGINLVDNLGHGITATINGQLYELTSYFIGNSSKSGRIEYTLPSLPAGSYKLDLKIWDVWNNSSTKSINFIVDDIDDNSYTLDIEKTVVKDELNILFTTESKTSDVVLSYKIYDNSMSLKWQYYEAGKSSALNNHNHKWNLIGNDGYKLAPGVYTCIAKVKIGALEEDKTYYFVVL